MLAATTHLRMDERVKHLINESYVRICTFSWVLGVKAQRKAEEAAFVPSGANADGAVPERSVTRVGQHIHPRSGGVLDLSVVNET